MRHVFCDVTRGCVGAGSTHGLHLQGNPGILLQRADFSAIPWSAVPKSPSPTHPLSCHGEINPQTTSPRCKNQMTGWERAAREKIPPRAKVHKPIAAFHLSISVLRLTRQRYRHAPHALARPTPKTQTRPSMAR